MVAQLNFVTCIFVFYKYATHGTSTQTLVQNPILIHISPAGFVMSVLVGRTVGFVAILAMSGITKTVRVCQQLRTVSIIDHWVKALHGNA